MTTSPARIRLCRACSFLASSAGSWDTVQVAETQDPWETQGRWRQPWSWWSNPLSPPKHCVIMMQPFRREQTNGEILGDFHRNAFWVTFPRALRWQHDSEETLLFGCLLLSLSCELIRPSFSLQRCHWVLQVLDLHGCAQSPWKCPIVTYLLLLAKCLRIPSPNQYPLLKVVFECCLSSWFDNVTAFWVSVFEIKLIVEMMWKVFFLILHV